MRVLIAALSLFLLSGSAMVATADSAGLSGWRVVQSVGAVSTVTTKEIRVAVTPQEVLPLGTRIRTGDTGRAILIRGEEQIILDRNSEIVLDGERSVITRIRQRSGSALFSIGKQRGPHFEVNTPYLAALVKGTTFQVHVSRDQSDVAVIEGAVEVSSSDGEAVTLLTAGTTGVVRVQRPKEIEVLEAGRVKRRVTRDEGGWGGTTAAGPGGGGGGGGSGGPGGGAAPSGGLTGSFVGGDSGSDGFNLSRPEGGDNRHADNVGRVADGIGTADRAELDGGFLGGGGQRQRSSALDGDFTDTASLYIDDTATRERSHFSLSQRAQAPKLDLNGDLTGVMGGAVGLAPPSSRSALKFQPGAQLLDATGRKIALPKVEITADDLPSIPILDLFLCALLLLALMIGSHTLALSWRVHRERAEAAALTGKDRAAMRQDRILGRR